MLRTFMIIATAAVVVCGADRTKLRIEVFDAFGRSITDSLHASLYQDGDLVAKVDGGTPLVVTLPYGTYRLQLSCPGAELISRSLALSEPRQTLRLGLKVADVGDYVGSRPKLGTDLSGRVEPCATGHALWIKLFGVFTDVVVDTKVEADCRFRIHAVPYGEYLGVLIDGGAVKDVKTIELRNEVQQVVFTATRETANGGR